MATHQESSRAAAYASTGNNGAKDVVLSAMLTSSRPHLPLVLRVTSVHNQVTLLVKVICSALLGEEDYLWGQAYQDAAKKLIACELDIFSKIVQHSSTARVDFRKTSVASSLA